MIVNYEHVAIVNYELEVLAKQQNKLRVLQ